MPEIFDHVLEANRVPGVGLDQRLVCRENRGALLAGRLFIGPGRVERVRRRVASRGLQSEKIVEAQALKKRVISGVRTDDSQHLAAFFTQMESHRRKRAHECRVHEFALREIENIITMTLGNHSLEEFPYTAAVLKIPPSIDLHPKRAAGISDEDGRDFNHVGKGLLDGAGYRHM